MPPWKLGRALGRCPHCGMAPLSTSCFLRALPLGAVALQPHAGRRGWSSLVRCGRALAARGRGARGRGTMGRGPPAAEEADESARHLVESAKIGVLRVAQGGLAGAARGPRPTRAVLRSAQGPPTLPGRPEWAMGLCPHTVVWRHFEPAGPLSTDMPGHQGRTPRPTARRPPPRTPTSAGTGSTRQPHCPLVRGSASRASCAA